jgi:hypothetical protein
MSKETEVFGVNYERFSVGRKLDRLAQKYNLRTILEMPAHGAKAMPSIYSLGFAKEVDLITLVNGNSKYVSEWEKIHADHKIKWVNERDMCHTRFADNSFDFVWNFAYIPICKKPDDFIEEMKRVSKRYVAIFSVNSGNIGFPIHRFVHKKTKIEWTHGDIRYNNRHFIKKKMYEHGLRVVETGFVDCPVWPDSLGFRDVRLHRMNIDFNMMDWEAPYVAMLANSTFPLWMRLVYMVENLPFPKCIKSIYAHINYTVAEKVN